MTKIIGGKEDERTEDENGRERERERKSRTLFYMNRTFGGRACVTKSQILRKENLDASTRKSHTKKVVSIPIFLIT